MAQHDVIALRMRRKLGHVAVGRITAGSKNERIGQENADRHEAVLGDADIDLRSNDWNTDNKRSDNRAVRRGLEHLQRAGKRAVTATRAVDDTGGHTCRVLHVLCDHAGQDVLEVTRRPRNDELNGARRIVGAHRICDDQAEHAEHHCCENSFHGLPPNIRDIGDLNRMSNVPETLPHG